MTLPRSALVSLNDTPWYHCVSRCVRRAFLCGQDRCTGQSFEHRRGWIADRIRQLAHVFAIDVAAYAVMSNHYHLVVRVDAHRALGWETEEVLQRWTQLFTGPPLVTRFLSAARAEMVPAERDAVEAVAATYRNRLSDLSWFMRVLNESLARRANAEDDCTGRFWEGRFKSQALLDEPAVLTAMAYVDLNPVRAGLAETPEASDYTSIQERLARAPVAGGAAAPERAEPVVTASRSDRRSASAAPAAYTTPGPLLQAPLMPFDATGQTPWAVPFALEDYVELVDWGGRVLHPGKKGRIAAGQPKIQNSGAPRHGCRTGNRTAWHQAQ
jgi:REP element-mobilizing transposase RayT